MTKAFSNQCNHRGIKPSSVNKLSYRIDNRKLFSNFGIINIIEVSNSIKLARLLLGY